MPSYPVLEIEGSETDLELALAFLMDRGCLGMEENPAGTSLRAFFPEGSELGPLLGELATSFPALALRPGAPESYRDWLSEWKDSLSSFALGESFFVLPTWKPVPLLERFILRLDPEQAFGTGTHDTTRLAATLLERFVGAGDRVIDVGAGTGILAMVAGRLGADSVLALDPDPDAVGAARANFARSALSRSIEVVRGGFEDFEALEADVIVANVNAPILARALERMRARTIVLSGILAEEVDEFVRGLAPRFAAREIWCAGEWSALVLTELSRARPSAPR